ncbi:hypothetical protein D3C81_1586520 [compost metagenome]
MGNQNMMGNVQSKLEILVARSVIAKLIGKEGDAPRLIKCNPFVNLAVKGLKHSLSIANKSINRVTGIPSSAFLKSLGKIPVV